MQDFLQTTLDNIKPVNLALGTQAQARLDNLTKPLGSLGRLEDLAKQIYCIQENSTLQVDPVCIFTVAADHGITEEHISAFPAEVTRQMVLNFLAGGAGINVLCQCHDISLFIVDAGCFGQAFPQHPLLIDRKLGKGTKNFSKEPAMSREICIKALNYGIGLANDAAANGYKTVGIGEMGIGNTTTATALFCAFLNLNAKDITGPGAGSPPRGLSYKAQVVENALNFHAEALVNADAIDVLAHFGGFEIAVMAGIALGCAKNGLILMVDGFISTAAYVAAYKICPHIQGYSILSHTSAEPGYLHVINSLNDESILPLLNLNLRLGEGTGIALAIPILRSAASVFNKMATFADANITS